uniref:Alpha-mannosidase n=1 Tax=Cucumis melo TaxID=3656 RepID=A0A9I9CSZ6_CUCME
MEKQANSCLPFSFLVLVLIFFCVEVDCNFVNYDTGGGVVDGKLNVHLVAHSHDDVGWLKTIDQYYVGSNNSIQGACVQNVLDSVVDSLLRDSNRKFVFAEMVFQVSHLDFAISIHVEVKALDLLMSPQLEKAINGGWCMHDEATSHYIDMIDQTTLGHSVIKEEFNKVPRAGWQIDPFGHSAVQAYLLSAEVGFESVHFARIDYQDREKRKVDKSLEVVWRGSKTFGSSSQIFTNAFPVHYSPPPGFHFEVNDDSNLIQDDPSLYDYNVEQRVNDFIDAALTQANITRTNHIMWTMGDDFQYQYAESWFRQMDKFIHYIKKDGRINALYSTPSIYTDAKHAANESWPLKTDDFFPYADRAHAYWTGFFTSRPAFKGYIRTLSGYYLAARQLEFLVGRKSGGPNTFSLGDALGVAQHHDAVTGTAKQHTTNDYMKRLAAGSSECPLLNISFCPPTEQDIQKGNSLVMVVYNPLGWIRNDVVRIPVHDADLVVQDISGKTIETQFVAIDKVTNSISEFYVKANLGLPRGQFPKYWLLFQVSVPQLGWNTYFISKGNGGGKRRSEFFPTDSQNDTIEVGPGHLKMSFSNASGQLKRMFNSKTGIPVEIIRGPLVDEVRQQFSPWVYQVGPIPVDDSVGKEVITRLTTNMVTNKTFYTDSNGRDFLKRVRDYRQDWNLSVNEPQAGNYYPLNLGIYTTDGKTELSVLVDRATGAASINDGQLELMLHRRTLFDDSRGVGEPLDELVCANDQCQGLTVRGNYYVNINQLGSGASWRRKTGQEIYSPLLLAFAHDKRESWIASKVTKSTTMDPNYSFPLNVALITLQELNDGSVLLRLAHLYEAEEDPEYSKLAKVELKRMFLKKSIKEVKEMSLSANQLKSEMKKKVWKVEGDGKTEATPVRGGPIDQSALLVELGPMEIRTFVLKF